MKRSYHHKPDIRAYLLSGLLVLLLMFFAVVAVALYMTATAAIIDAKKSKELSSTVDISEPQIVAEAIPEPSVGVTPEEMLELYLADGYFRDDIPLDYQLQAYLRGACEEFDVPYELALAVIHRETNFSNVMGDNGNSYGYMQIQPRWHQWRMDELGVTDLLDPLSNFRVGCHFLRELMDRYTLEEALTAYNRGTPGTSEYATAVLAMMEGYTYG